MNILANSKVLERLANREVYDSEINAPPAEKLEHVIQFELTTGCSYGGCGFCTMYKGQPHNVKTYDEFTQHVDKVWDNFSNPKKGIFRSKKVNDPSKLERIFIGSGNALRVEPKLLEDAIEYSIKTFKKNTGKLPGRIAMYGNTRDILAKGKFNLSSNTRDLRFLNCGGTCSGGCSMNKFGEKIGLGLIYWGIESGSSEVLKFADKGYSRDEVIEAGSILDSSGVKVSAMIITGLGGKRLAEDHTEKTIRVLNSIDPRFITFIGINADETTRYGMKMADEEKNGLNRALTNSELLNQMADIIQGLRSSTTIGCHGTNVHRFGFNPIDFGSVDINKHYSSDERDNLVKKIREKAKNL